MKNHEKSCKDFCYRLAVVIVIVLAYAAYVFIDYYRLEDNMELTPEASSADLGQVPVGEELTVTSWNIGFGAYTDRFSFFMDGGEYSRGFSEEIVSDTVKQMAYDLASFDSDFYLLQEVDIDSDRSYHLNQYDMMTEPFDKMDKVFAQNYDSPYLFYPILSPHGKSKSGIVTLSDYVISSSLRRSLPIQEGFAKLLDLDRCYSISRSH